MELQSQLLKMESLKGKIYRKMDDITEEDQKQNETKQMAEIKFQREDVMEKLKLVGIEIDHNQMGNYGHQTENLVKLLEEYKKW